MRTLLDNIVNKYHHNPKLEISGGYVYDILSFGTPIHNHLNISSSDLSFLTDCFEMAKEYCYQEEANNYGYKVEIEDRMNEDWFTTVSLWDTKNDYIVNQITFLLDDQNYGQLVPFENTEIYTYDSAFRANIILQNLVNGVQGVGDQLVYWPYIRDKIDINKIFNIGSDTPIEYLLDDIDWFKIHIDFTRVRLYYQQAGIDVSSLDFQEIRDDFMQFYYKVKELYNL